jgi:hypothetical protein
VKLRRFRELAARMYEEIPDPFREGVTGLVVETDAPGHPTLSGIWTLGECVTEGWPDGTGGEQVQSRIVLHYGSFRALAAEDPNFDWEAELWETLVHELLHHREAAAFEDGLDRFDWAVDQNFLRHAGRPFDPDFVRAVPADEEGVVRLEEESFIEVELPVGATDARFDWRGRAYCLRVPDTEAPLFVHVRNLGGGRLWVVVRRRRSWWRRLASGGLRPETVERRALPAPPVAA